MAVTKPSPGDERRPDAIGSLRRDDRFARRVALHWRRLTGQARDDEANTLIACSGGADSTALVLALTLATRTITVAHVLHDLRRKADADADRDAVPTLARRLNLPFVQAEVQVASCPGNREASARRERYAALARLALENNCPFVATAHHADDQLETLLMALLRGSGPRGLCGIAPKLPLPSGEGGESARRERDTAPIILIRPMLHCTRAEARAACTAAGIEWREDATNLDTTRLRAAIRADILPRLTALRPESPRRAARTAELFRDAATIIDDRVAALFGDATEWPRGALRVQPPIILGAGLRRSAARALGERFIDQLSSRLVDDAVRAIRDDSTEPREFHWPGGLRVRVDSHQISVSNQ